MTQPADSVVPAVRLIFDWAARKDRRRRLAFWLVLVLVIHVLGFVAFRMDVPPVNPREISDATLYVPEPGSEIATTLKAYLAAEDPSLFAADRSSRVQAEPELPGYRPGFDTRDFKPLPLPTPATRILPSLAIPVAAVEIESVPTSPPGSVDRHDPAVTVIHLGGELAGRAWEVPPEVAGIAPGGASLLPSVFIIGVTPAGRIRHALNREGSGNPAVDAAALQAILRAAFTSVPDDSGAAWGTLTIHWAPQSDTQP